MNSIRAWPQLATTLAMVLLAIATDTDWIRVTAIVVGLLSLFLFLKGNLKK